MLVRLVHNTVVSGFVFGLVALLGLLVVSIIVKTWGVAEFGLIVLARLLLPTGMLALVDLGIADVTTNAIARARENRDWTAAGKRLTVLVGMGTAVGVSVGLLLWATAPALAQLLQVDEAHRSSFVPLLVATAAANFVLLPGLVAEGVVKGFERHALLRWSELASTVAYVIATAYLASAGAGYEWVAYAFLMAILLRTIFLMVVAVVVLRRYRAAPGWADKTILRDLLRHSALLFQGKLIGLVQGPAQPLAISALFGPAATGLYEAIVRLPRFTKVLSSLFTSALLPVASRLHEAGRDVELVRVGSAGLVLLPALTLPPLVAAAILSEEILRLWLGPTLAPYGAWMALAFVSAMAVQFILVGNMMAISRAEVLSRLNRLGLVQIAVWAAVAVAGLSMFEERAFIMAQAVAALALLPLQVSVIVQAIGASRRVLMGRALRQVLVIGLGALAIAAWREANGVDGLVELCVTASAACVAMWGAQAVVVFTVDDRATILRLAAAGLPGRFARGFGRAADRTRMKGR